MVNGSNYTNHTDLFDYVPVTYNLTNAIQSFLAETDLLNFSISASYLDFSNASIPPPLTSASFFTVPELPHPEFYV